MFVAALGLLVSGSPALTVSVVEGLPLGTPLTWAGLVSLPLMALSGVPALRRPSDRRARIYAAIFKACLALAALWGIVSFLLAGNWSYSFTSSATGFRGSTRAAPYFFDLTYATAGLPIFAAAIFGLHVWVAGRLAAREEARESAPTPPD